MSVDVQPGDFNIQATDRAFYGIIDAAVNVVVSASSPSNPRKDAVVAYIDLSVVSSASNDNPGALKFLAVAGTPAGAPTDPSAGTIQAAVGASNPYAILARVDVPTSSSTVVTANITDRRNPSALAVPYLYGGANNTNGHLVPNVADDTVALLNATQTLAGKTLTAPVVDQFGASSGLGAPWTSWAPTWTGLTVGNGAVTAKYQQIGKTVHYRLYVLFGTTTSISAGVNFSLPVTSVSYPGATMLGQARYEDASVGNSIGHVMWNSTTVASLEVQGAASAYVIASAVISVGIPQTWNTNDVIEAQGFYEAA